MISFTVDLKRYDDELRRWGLRTAREMSRVITPALDSSVKALMRDMERIIPRETGITRRALRRSRFRKFISARKSGRNIAAGRSGRIHYAAWGWRHEPYRVSEYKRYSSSVGGYWNRGRTGGTRFEYYRRTRRISRGFTHTKGKFKGKTLQRVAGTRRAIALTAPVRINRELARTVSRRGRVHFRDQFWRHAKKIPGWRPPSRGRAA